MIIAPSSARTRVVITTPSERLGIAIRRGELEGIVIRQAAVESPLLAPVRCNALALAHGAIPVWYKTNSVAICQKVYPSKPKSASFSKLSSPAGGPTGPAFWRFGESLA